MGGAREDRLKGVIHTQHEVSRVTIHAARESRGIGKGVIVAFIKEIVDIEAYIDIVSRFIADNQVN